ncbi:MAG: alkaline phosphatase family protein, partial [Myxococcota bacterium]
MRIFRGDKAHLLAPVIAMTAMLSPISEASAKDVRLVVLAVVDQLTSEHVVRYAPLFTGGLARMRSGAVYLDARYEYAGTETGPGHATIATGTWPDEHGIVANRWVDEATGATVLCVGDPQHKYSPHRLKVSGLADALKLATRGRAKVVALGIKPRSSILLGGQRPDLVAFYSGGRFQAGQWPGVDPVPSWFRRAVLKVGPRAADGQTWRRFRDDVDYERWAGPDDRPFEQDVPGLGRTFDRNLGQDAKTWDRTYPGTPAAQSDLVKLAMTAVDEVALGTDDHPDLLTLGFSTLDYVGHWYGPDSQESLDI